MGPTQVAAEASSGHGLPLGGEARARGRLLQLFGDEALLTASTATFAAALVWRLSGQVNQDAWLALVGGREIVHHGLPHHETLTVWGHGHAWIDQQWLAQLALYGLWALGGLTFLAFAHALLTTAAYSVAVVAARRLGGSSRSVLFFLPACFWLLIGSTWQVRTQTLSYLPFVLLVWLLAADARRPSRRVYLALPLIALWANLHGSVVLAAALVALRGAAYAFEGPRLRLRAGLLMLAPALLLASPYGLSLVGYYRDTLFNSAFSSMLNEWQPPKLGLTTSPFFGLLLAVAWLAGRARRSLRPFELLALGFTGLAGLAAVRNLGWFALTALILAPALVDQSWPERSGQRVTAGASRLNAALAAVAVATLVALLGATVARPAGWFEDRYPAAAGDAVARAAAADQTARIYADVAYGDWLLWRHPELAGRIAYDARFELLSGRQVFAVYDFNVALGGTWREATRGYRLLLLDGAVSKGPIRSLERARGARVLYSGSDAVAIQRGDR
jgi:hypothetical protein